MLQVQATGPVGKGMLSKASKPLPGLSENGRRPLALEERLLPFPVRNEVIHHHGRQDSDSE